MIHPTLALVLAAAATLVQSDLSPAGQHLSGSSVAIGSNRNTVPAGRVVNGERRVELAVIRGRWYPEADNGAYHEVLAFAERGKAPTIPGPLLRVDAGTPMRIVVHNPLGEVLNVLGLADHPASRDPVRIPARSSHTFAFTATAAGTFAYSAFTGADPEATFAESSQLTGAFIVDDPANRRADRVFVIGVRFEAADTTAAGVTPEEITMVINGKSWPYTERLEMTQGDSVHWRIVNASVDPHPMHLHGFYFRVDSRGSVYGDTIYSPDQQRLAVTELMYAGSTYMMSFVPINPGNWVYHCHFAFHVGPHVAMRPVQQAGNGHDAHAADRHMSGLVLGLHVKPSGAAPQPTARRREINLYVQSKPKHYRHGAGLAFVQQEGETPPAEDSLPSVFKPLILARDEPVRINVINRMPEATAVHWHGIELESFPDGVPDFSGMPGNLFTRVPARGSFAAEFTPPRAGTFIYHSHLNEMNQIMSGLFGALIVLEPGQTFDPEHDKVFVVGGAGPPDSLFLEPPAGSINGQRAPSSTRLYAGETYRIRLININPDWRVEFTLGSDTALVRWKPIAKDGADLPESQRTPRAAFLFTGPGETADFEFTPAAPGFVRLIARTRDPGWHTRVNMPILPARRTASSTPD